MTTDPTLARLLRHMAWANAALFERLGTLPNEALVLATPRNEWTVAMIAAHIVSAAGRCAGRLEGGVLPPDLAPPTTTVEVAAVARVCADYDRRLLAAAAVPESIVEFHDRDGGVRRRARSTILGQAIHHATEHRAQVAGALATNGVDAIDLDALDLWAFGVAEGLGA